jgi:hypothetical protein
MLRLSENKMNCCANPSKSRSHRVTTITRWLLPSAFLVLIPKCPLCIVAYIAVATGAGISVSTAAGIRYALIAGCIGLLAFAVLRSLSKRPHITT